MSIRLRRVGSTLIAICAARSVPKDGDIYLDDEAHHALMVKFDLDIASERGIAAWNSAAPEVALMEQEESNNPARQWWDKTYTPPSLAGRVVL